MDPYLGLLFVILVLLSAFFSGTEIALMNLSKHAIVGLRREKRPGSRSLEIIRKDSDTLLITILIGNNLVNVGASSLATMLSLTLAGGIGFPSEYGVAIATGAVTLILLTFGEITPKTICLRYAPAVALFSAPIYRVLIILFYPISFFLNLFVKSIAKLIGSNSSRKMSPKEFEALIDASHADGVVEQEEKRQIKNLLTLGDMTAASVMTPRVNVDLVSTDMSVAEVCEFFMNASHSRLPVYRENIDHIEYVITFREAFKLQAQGYGARKLDDLDLEKILRVSFTQPLDDLFEKFQKSRRHIALVVDEYGGTAGIVTMEDVLEEVFGDIKDEKDREEIYIKRTGKNVLEAVGTALVEDVLEEFDISLHEFEKLEEYIGKSLTYLLNTELEGFPKKDDVVKFSSEIGTISLGVESIDEGIIQKVLVRFSPMEEEK